MKKQIKGRMDVRRIETEGGSHIEPPLDREWTLYDKLRWQAGVVHADTGLDITVKPSDYRVDGVPIEGYADIIIAGSTVAGPCAYSWARTAMDGIEIGYRAAKKEVDR
jgi:hypothetical protein